MDIMSFDGGCLKSRMVVNGFEGVRRELIRSYGEIKPRRKIADRANSRVEHARKLYSKWYLNYQMKAKSPDLSKIVSIYKPKKEANSNLKSP
jgi:hypothetical protein